MLEFSLPWPISTSLSIFCTSPNISFDTVANCAIAGVNSFCKDNFKFWAAVSAPITAFCNLPEAFACASAAATADFKFSSVSLNCCCPKESALLAKSLSPDAPAIAPVDIARAVSP